MNQSWHECYQTQLSWHRLASYSMTAVSPVDKDNKYGVQTWFQHASWVSWSQLDNSKYRCEMSPRWFGDTFEIRSVRPRSDVIWATSMDLPIQLTSSVKQEDKATTTLPVWALLRCQSQQQMFVNKLSVSNKPTTGLINHSNPRLPYKPCDFKSCWVRRN